MEFIHLNVHSHYSKGWGIPTIEELCHAARALGMKRLALTDTNGLYGLIFFIQEAREAGIEPIIGSELVAGSHRALLLVKDHQGYKNLCRIISARHCDQDFDLIRSIALNRGGLIVISDDFKLLKALSPAMMTAWSTASSAATLPITMSNLEKRFCFWSNGWRLAIFGFH